MNFSWWACIKIVIQRKKKDESSGGAVGWWNDVGKLAEDDGGWGGLFVSER